MAPEGSLDCGAYRDSLDFAYGGCAGLRNENARLREQLKSKDLDLAILKAEYENQVTLKDYLKAELKNTEADLNYVERQFVSLERSIQADETRASAVAAVAEVQILREKLQRENPELLDSLTVKEINARLAKSDDMIHEHNYAAAVYHATRAMRILNLTERRLYTHADGATRVVTVSSANLRSGPGSKFEVLEQLKFGTVVVELKARKNWYQIRTKKGKTGWIYSSLVR